MGTKGRFSNPFTAVFTGVLDVFRAKPDIGAYSTLPSLEGVTCLVTGANSGLGYGISLLLAKKGARVIMGCRRDYSEVRNRLSQLSGSDNIALQRLDLTDRNSIYGFAEQMEKEGVQIDVSIHNAGVTTPIATKLPNGLDEMFMVNYLSKFILTNALISRGVIHSKATLNRWGRPPRIILISSDSHQGASAIDWQQLGLFEPYKGPNRAVSLYSYNKLLLNTFGIELGRQLKKGIDGPIDVLIMCPGPVNSNIIRRAPVLLRGALRLIFYLFFKDPVKAAEPVAVLAGSTALIGRSGIYWHMWEEKMMDPKCYGEAEGKRLWEASKKLEEDIGN